MQRYRLAIANLLLALAPAAAATTQPGPAASSVAVWVGEIDGLDACGGSGRIIGSTARPVFAAPRDDARQTGRLPAGSDIWLCDASDDEGWYGIVYPAAEDQDCGVSVPATRHQPYPGPCRSGWVRAADVALMAG